MKRLFKHEFDPSRLPAEVVLQDVSWVTPCARVIEVGLHARLKDRRVLVSNDYGGLPNARTLRPILHHVVGHVYFNFATLGHNSVFNVRLVPLCRRQERARQ